MSQTFLLEIWFYLSICLILSLLAVIFSSGQQSEKLEWEKEKYNFFPYTWPDSPNEKRKMEKLDSIERIQRQLWYKEFFKD